MESEKVKDIKKALKYCCGECDCDCPFYKNGKSYEKCKSLLLFEALTLINELENENEMLLGVIDVANERDYRKKFNDEWRKEYQKELDKQGNGHIAGYPDFDLVYKLYFEQKDRIAELEEALLDMVVQFCQMSKEGYLHHTFMSAEENAFNVLDIEYGEKVDDVYKRFNEKWGRND